MKNVTLSIEEQVLRRVRRYASAHDTSVNALVRTYLADLANREDRAQLARRRIRELSRRSRARLGARSWTRDGLHER